MSDHVDDDSPAVWTELASGKETDLVQQPDPLPSPQPKPQRYLDKRIVTTRRELLLVYAELFAFGVLFGWLMLAIGKLIKG